MSICIECKNKISGSVHDKYRRNSIIKQEHYCDNCWNILGRPSAQKVIGKFTKNNT